MGEAERAVERLLDSKVALLGEFGLDDALQDQGSSRGRTDITSWTEKKQ